jgi:hypothetical protein
MMLKSVMKNLKGISHHILIKFWQAIEKCIQRSIDSYFIFGIRKSDHNSTLHFHNKGMGEILACQLFLFQKCDIYYYHIALLNAVIERIIIKIMLNLFVIVLCRIISILTVFVNKALLSSQTVSLDAPLFVTWYQCVVSATICFTLSMLTKSFPQTFTFPEGSPLNREVAAKVCGRLCSLSIYLHYMILKCICM